MYSATGSILTADTSISLSQTGHEKSCFNSYLNSECPIPGYTMVDLFQKNIIIGENNVFEEGVIFHPNIIIGNGNTFKRGTVIYKNTVIGNDNVFMEENTLGSLVVEANKEYEEIKDSRNGLVIGNGNTFHIKNIISSGYYEKTIIGNYNKILSDVYISHDNVIGDYCVFYPRVFSAGLVTFFEGASIGAGVCIHQKQKIGAYSMIGMNSTITKNVKPYSVVINNKFSRINTAKLDVSFERAFPQKGEGMTTLQKYKDQITMYYHHDENPTIECILEKLAEVAE